MPVEIPRTSTSTKRIRFITNESYVGVDYGPSYRAKEANVREDWARYFVRNGKAVYVQGAVAVELPADDGGEQPRGTSEKGAIEASDDALPDDLQGVEALRDAGVTTWAELEAVEDLTVIRGIGTRTAGQIEAAKQARADG
jgi:hypothetical protein